MVFNSFSFLLFFPLVTLIYFLLPHRFRWVHLLISSCIFYMFFIPIYILILIFTIIIDYFAGIMIDQAQGRRRKAFLLLSLAANIGVLAVFKYYNFFLGNLNWVTDLFGVSMDIPYLNIILPIGLSFHTFQAMSYTIEVYRGNFKPVRDFGIYSLYVMFYPQLVAGPIERPQNLIPQFYQKHEFDYDRVISGLKLMLWGLFKKVVIADRLGAYVANVFNFPHQHSGEPLTFWVSAWFFAIQLYCDFGGYSDMAIGSARIMGFNLMTNFRRPYLGRSVGEVWQRWHISLTTWFGDYVFKPLGGYRKGKWRGIFNLGVLMFLAGLWHGANWTYVLCFLLFFIFLASRLVMKKQIEKFDKVVYGIHPLFGRIVGTILAFHCGIFSYIFFRSMSVQDALYYYSQMFSFKSLKFYDGDQSTMWYGLFGIVCLFSVEIYQEEYTKDKNAIFPEPRNNVLRYLFYAGVISIILLIGVFDASQFIYFQF
ncbi:MAG: MBOAT family protein [Chitinophagales bacterium]|nr:MBOAT family protein [Chitinophagales bacterium]